MDTRNRLLETIDRFGAEAVSDVARKIVDDDSASEISYTLKPLAAESVGAGTVGFVKVEGAANSNGSPVNWSCLIKVIKPDGTNISGHGNDPLREIESNRSGGLQTLTAGLRAARCYAVTDASPGLTALWLEDLTLHRKDPWPIEDYKSAAYAVGVFNGSAPEQAVDDSWTWLERTGRADRRYGPLWPGVWQRPLEDELKRPLVAKAAGRVGNDRAATLRDDVEASIARTAGQPRSLAHNDCHPRNLFCLPSNASRSEVVAIDWASVGLSPVGLDMGTLFASGFTWTREEALNLFRNEREIFGAYADGLVDASWTQPIGEVRSTYKSVLVAYALHMLVGVLDRANGGPLGIALTRRLKTDASGLADQFAERIDWLLTIADSSE